MQPFRLTLKNYRCFADNAPLVVDVRPGMTGLIGPNNSGKSTLLKFFHEMRRVLTSLGDTGHWAQWLQGNERQLLPVGTDDPLEIFHNGNNRPLEITIELLDARIDTVSKIVLRCPRRADLTFTAELFVGPDQVKAEQVGSSSGTHVVFQVVGEPKGRTAHVEPWRTLGAWADAVVYIGPHRSAIGQSSGSYYDLAIGSDFITLWTAWKTGASRQQNRAALGVSEEIARIFGFKRVEINAAVGNNLQVTLDGEPYLLRELGAGIAQFIVVLGNVMVRQPSMLLFDEPEVHLHPSLQVEFLLSLARYAGSGVIFATHSLGLARSTADVLYSFRKEGRRSSVRPYEQTIDFVEFLGELSYGAYQELGCDTILLAEGINEVKTCQSLLRFNGKEHRVVVLPIGGDQFFSEDRVQELVELKRLASNIAVLIDSERKAEGADIPEPRRAFAERCRENGFKVCVTERRAFENYIPDRAIKDAFPNQDFSALGPFESLSARKPNWGKRNNWKAVRSMTADDLRGTDLGAFIESL